MCVTGAPESLRRASVATQVIGPVNSATNWVRALLQNNCGVEAVPCLPVYCTVIAILRTLQSRCCGQVHNKLYANKHSFNHEVYLRSGTLAAHPRHTPALLSPPVLMSPPVTSGADEPTCHPVLMSRCCADSVQTPC